MSAVIDALASFAAAIDSGTRLYRLEGEGALAQLDVEAWSLDERLSEPWTLELSALSTRAGLDLADMIGRKLVLQTVLADGSLGPRSGIVTVAEEDEGDGGFARYRLTVRPWIALLAGARRSRVWQEKTLVEIVEDVFASHQPNAHWTWSADVSAHLQQSPFAAGGVRSYTVQYRESDLAFVQRLLAEEGIGWRVQEDGQAPLGHTIVLFADSPSEASCPADPTSAAGGGIRFHRSAAVETRDAIQAFGAERELRAATATVLSWDYKGKRAVAASVPTAADFAGPNAPRLEACDAVGAYAFADAGAAQRAATLLQQAAEARHKTWLGRSTVRSLRSGCTFALTDSPLDTLAALGRGPQDRRFLVTAVTHAGINNLPKAIGARSAEQIAAWVDDEVRAQAVQTGYGNALKAIRAHVPWRPAREDGTGERLNPKPTAPGPLVATVVGAEGATSGASEIHTDRLGRIRIRHDFQAEGEASTWVRVMQRQAGAGMGAQFIPRLGQQVLVGFIEDDIDRPIVLGALYDGRGEAGTAPTPGGQAAEGDTGAFARSSDHAPAAQGNLTGGHAPAWHGASPAEWSAGGQRNAAALSGWKTREFGGAGYNQLVFDDSDGQLRMQLASTQHASQLNLGHLIHQADNHRGSFRGLGFELRTDAYGTVRGRQGLLISSFGTQGSEPAGDNAAGIALAGQLETLGRTFSQAAGTHQTVKLAGQIGSVQGNQSALSDRQAPYAALHTALKGMVSRASTGEANADAAAKATATAQDKLPHPTDPVVAIAAKAGLAQAAGQDIHWAAGETVTLASGQDTTLASGGAYRIHSGQAIGMLAGAVGAGAEAAGKGLTLIAGQGDVEVQAQAGAMQVAAKQDVSIQSQSKHVDWAAAKRIVLATAGGANITIEGGNITVTCPGKITVLAGKKSFVGPETQSYPFPQLPKAPMPLRELKFNMVLTDVPGPKGHALAFTPWKIARSRTAPDGLALVGDDQLVASGTTDAQGRVKLDTAQEKELARVYCQDPNSVWLVHPGHTVRISVAAESPDWSQEDKLLHALNASDFSGDLHVGRYSDGIEDQIHYAKSAVDAAGESQLLGKLKGT